MKSRLLVAAIGVPLLLVIILLAPVWVLAAALMLLSAIAAWELVRCVGAGAFVPLCNVAILGGICTVAAVLKPESVFGMLLTAFVLLLFGYGVWKAGEVKLLHLLTALFAMLAVPYSFSAFLRLDAAGYHRGFLLLPLLFSFASDTGAFFIGRAFGKQKLAPKVSPHKTVAGAFGGLAGNVVGALAFVFVMNTWFGHSLSYVTLAAIGLLCSVVAQLGDLSFSLIKREFGVKDYGKLFLAHGGVLDRFDSVLFVAPALEIFLRLVSIGV